jgi:hypothetical protein
MSDLYEFDWGSDFGGGGVASDPYMYSVPEFEMPAYSYDAGDVGADYYLPSYDALPTYDYAPASYDYTLGGPGIYDAYTRLSDEYGGYEQAGAGAITAFDPSTGTYFDRAGNPVTPQAGGPTMGPLTPSTQVTAAQDPEAFLRQGAYSQSPYSTGGGYGGVPTTQNPQGGGQPGGGGWLDAINSFIKGSPQLAGLLGAAGVGAAGLGIARGLAGPLPRPPAPTLAPGSPILAGGQNTMAQMFADQAAREAGYQAAQAPGYEQIRNQAMTLIPGQLNPVTVENYNDPVQAALRAELMATMQGGASPLVEDQIRKQWDTLQNTMFRRLGPDWELSSAGQETLQAFNRNATIARDESKRGTVAAYSPLEQSRAQYAYQAPVQKAQALGGEQRAYVGTLAGASALGRMDPYQLQTALGGSPDQYRALLTTLGSQGQTAGYNTRVADRSSLMSGVGSVAGTVAGQVGSLGQTDRLARAVRELNGGSLPNTASSWSTWG